jgi:carbon monoxide dehydrogenase subunit G
MELNDEFEVPLPVAEAWALLTDAERIVPCVPGAELREVEGDELRGVMKVRVGPVTVSYRGNARVESLDGDAHKLALKAEGREIRGQGSATAAITATLSPSAKGTKVRVATDLSVSGKLAQFDRDELAEVSARLVVEFARNLESILPVAPEATTSQTAEAESAAEDDIEAAVASYRAEAEAEVAYGEVEATEEAASKEADSVAVGDGETYPSTFEHEEERESLMRRLAPYLTVAGFLLIARIVVYSLRRRRR